MPDRLTAAAVLHRRKNDLRWESMNRKLLVFSLALALARTLTGCGAPAAPEPPSLNLPIPVANLSAARTGNTVRLAWTMPRRTTDRVALRHPISAGVCRATDNAACTEVATLDLAPGATGSYADTLPPDLAQSPDRLLRYEVFLRNRAGKSAGPSNPAYSAACSSPAAVTGLTAQMRPEGVLLSWKPVSDPGRAVVIRIERVQLTLPPATETRRSPLATAPPPAAQTLAVHPQDGVDPGHAIDASALLNQRYRYTLERVATLAPGGQSVEIQGSPSEPIEVSTKDTFPPAIPEGLVAVADSAAGAIDLSWMPDSEPDLAAYHIYRRDFQGGVPARQIASVGVETSFRDTGVEAGHTYAYSVSAVDQTGIESNRSPEVNETLPAR
jgi:hypothetical protein